MLSAEADDAEGMFIWRRIDADSNSLTEVGGASVPLCDSPYWSVVEASAQKM